MKAKLHANDTSSARPFDALQLPPYFVCNLPDNPEPQALAVGQGVLTGATQKLNLFAGKTATAITNLYFQDLILP